MLLAPFSGYLRFVHKALFLLIGKVPHYLTLAMSVVQQSPELRPVQPLYDVLPSSQTTRDVSLSSSNDRLPR
jgi:hypothetical protein